MPDFEEIRKNITENSELSKTTIDEFLIYYAADRDRVDREFDARFSPFKAAGKGMPVSWIGLIKAQYIAHRIFRKGGLIRKYLNHSGLKTIDRAQQDYLHQLALHPWKFSFSEILSNPETDFYEMQDVFSGETYLLYSKSISQILKERPVMLWFNLIGFNEQCWQTFGPVGNFQCFNDDDIFFFATELTTDIESEDDLVEDIEHNPVPYMMLMTGAEFPLIRNENYEVLQVTAMNTSTDFEFEKIKERFRVEYAEGIFRISDPDLSGPPHFAEAFYNERMSTMFTSALTDTGYGILIDKLNQLGFRLPEDPDVRLHLPMITVMKNVLQKEIEINPYLQYFEKTEPAEDGALMVKLNRLLTLALPYINAGVEPDVDALAKEAGVDRETAKDLLSKSINHITKLKKKTPNPRQR